MDPEMLPNSPRRARAEPLPCPLGMLSSLPSQGFLLPQGKPSPQTGPPGSAPPGGRGASFGGPSSLSLFQERPFPQGCLAPAESWCAVVILQRRDGPHCSLNT